jgi:hypothetical protein
MGSQRRLACRGVSRARRPVPGVDGPRTPLSSAVGCYLSDIGDEVTGEVMHDVLHSCMTRKRTEELMQTVGARLRAEGRNEGEAKGRASYLLHTLAARGVRVDDSFRQRVLACKDVDTLDRWFDRALNAHTLAAKGMESAHAWSSCSPSRNSRKLGATG